MAQQKVKVILAEAHRIKAGDKVFVTIDPQWADLAEYIQQDLQEFGVDAMVVALPKGALQFFAIEQGINVQVDPKLTLGGPNGGK